MRDEWASQCGKLLASSFPLPASGFWLPASGFWLNGVESWSTGVTGDVFTCGTRQIGGHEGNARVNEITEGAKIREV